MRMPDKNRTAPCRKRLLLVAAVYVLAWFGAFCCGLVELAADAYARRAGTLAETQLSLADFQAVNAAVEKENVLVSENEDPQLLYAVPEGQRLKTLTLAVEYSKTPYERCIYYSTTEPGAFSGAKRVWPVENADGSLSFTLPRGVKYIRLDPGSRSGLRMEFVSVTANAERGAADYLVPDAGTLAMLVLVPGLCAAGLQWLSDCAADRKKKPE